MFFALFTFAKGSPILRYVNLHMSFNNTVNHIDLDGTILYQKYFLGGMNVVQMNLKLNCNSFMV